MSEPRKHDDYGEGNKSADRRYREKATEFGASERAEKAAKEAKEALESPEEAEQMEEAERKIRERRTPPPA